MKNILLIGGSYGIGAGIAQQLLNNSNVIIACRSHTNLPDGVTYYNFDVTKDAIKELHLPEKLDGLVYCPGTIHLKPFNRLSSENFEEDLQLNFLGLVKVLKELYPKLKASSKASVVLFSSVAAKIGMPFHTSIAASKGALEAFAKSLAAEWAPTIRVNVIAPSLTQTPLSQRLLNNDTKRGKMSERHPLKRIGEIEDIANTAVFLLSEKSSWITGQIIGVDGGMSTLNLG